MILKTRLDYQTIGNWIQSGSKVLDFRDKAFNIYFENADYLSMINKTYGEKTVNHIKKMTNHKINRKHHNTEVNY